VTYAARAPLSEVWHRAGRTARDARLRLMSLYGVLLTPPTLVLGSLLYRLSRGSAALSEMRRPLGYVLEPLRASWWASEDLALLCYVLLQGLLISALWGFVGGAVARMAAVQVATGRKEDGRAATAFARRHWRSTAGATTALLAACLLPVAVAICVAALGRLPGTWGSLLLAPAVLVVAALALVAVVAASVTLLCGFVAPATVACEDSDAFDAVSRVFGYAAAGLPRLFVVRLAFLGGVLIGVLWRAARTALALAVGAIVLRAGAGEAAFTRAVAILSAMDAPPDANRLGVLAGDYAVAAAMALVVGGLVALFLADLATRTICARIGAYLVLRQDVDRVPASDLHTPPAAPARLTAEQAGFAEVARVGRPAPAAASPSASPSDDES
jgi:hypothetical protein